MKNLPNYDPNNIMSWYQYDREKFLVKPEKKKKNSNIADLAQTLKMGGDDGEASPEYDRAVNNKLDTKDASQFMENSLMNSTVPV